MRSGKRFQKLWACGVTSLGVASLGRVLAKSGGHGRLHIDRVSLWTRFSRHGANSIGHGSLVHYSYRVLMYPTATDSEKDLPGLRASRSVERRRANLPCCASESLSVRDFSASALQLPPCRRRKIGPARQSSNSPGCRAPRHGPLFKCHRLPSTLARRVSKFR
jgi:hypothetical protein